MIRIIKFFRHNLDIGFGVGIKFKCGNMCNTVSHAKFLNVSSFDPITFHFSKFSNSGFIFKPMLGLNGTNLSRVFGILCKLMSWACV